MTQHALSGRSFPGIVVAFSTKHAHSLRIWNPKTKKVTTKGTIKFLGSEPHPTITFQYSVNQFDSSHPVSTDPLLLSPQTINFDHPDSSPPLLDKLGGTSDTSDELGGTDGESTDIAKYCAISKRYHRGCPRKYFVYVDRKFKDIADNLTFCIVGLAYNPDFKAKYFFKYFDTALYSTTPTDDDLFEYTPITEILSDSDNVFLPPDTRNVCPGPSAPARINLVTVGFVDPNVKSNRCYPDLRVS